MCGIAGIIKTGIGNKEEYKSIIKKMTNAIIHRGPDDEGAEFFDNAIIGFRRLSIVDLSQEGHQPMYSSTKNECISFNGEIYGYRDIKKNLPEYPFKNNTDTEVILALYQKYGKELPEHLNGMFAFAIWNEEKQELFCARDRFGEKPFYYAFGENGEFIYASEVKAILASGLVKPVINEEALAHYLKHLYLDRQQCIYKNIFVLPSAHTLLYKDGKIEIKKYWKIPQQEIEISEEEAIEKLRELMEKSIQKYIHADAKVGAFLSGGLDSGMVVALSSKYTDKLSTIGFAYEGDMNEMPEARKMAEKYNCDHHEVYMNDEEIAEVMEKIYSKLDEPLGDSALPALYKICEKAREEMKVVITGNGGDELFGGYGWYQTELEIMKEGKTSPILLPFYKLGSLISDKLNLQKPLAFFRKKVFFGKNPDIVTFHKKIYNFFSDAEIRELGVTAEYKKDYGLSLDPKTLNTCLNMDLMDVFQGDFMVKDDRISMMNSIELRNPFLDKDLVEFCVSLPAKYKVDENQRKIILRKAFGDKLHPDILSKSKQGFGAPRERWLRKPAVEELTQKYLKNPQNKMFRYLSYDVVQKHLSYGQKHWSLLVLGIWFDKVYAGN